MLAAFNFFFSVSAPGCLIFFFFFIIISENASFRSASEEEARSPGREEREICGCKRGANATTSVLSVQML